VVAPECGFTKRSGLAMARKSSCSMSPAPGALARDFLRGVRMLLSMKRGDRIAVIVCAVALVAAAVLGYFVAGWMFGTH
jgi:hypothetical protein